MCWAWPTPGSIPTAVRRLSAAINQFRQMQQDVTQQPVPVDQVQKLLQQAKVEPGAPAKAQQPSAQLPGALPAAQ